MLIVTDEDSKNRLLRHKKCRIAAYDKEDLKNDFLALFNAIIKDTEVTMIFLEELSHIQPILEERIKDVQNSISNSDRE